LGALLKIVAGLLERFKLLRILRWWLPGLVSPWRRHAEHALRCGHDWRHTLSLTLRSLVCQKLAKIAGKQVRVGMSAVALPSGAARRIKRLQGRKNLDILRSALLQHCGALLLHHLQRRNELRHDKQLRIDGRRRHSGERREPIESESKVNTRGERINWRVMKKHSFLEAIARTS
jgi:hypothetical protein